MEVGSLVEEIVSATSDSEKEQAAADLKYAWRALSVVGMASFLGALNNSTLNIALPEVVRHFNASSVSASWIVIIFALVSTLVTLACGRLADVMGRRKMYLIGLSLFTVVSLLLGFSPDVKVLLVLRAIQAIAEAMLLANSAAIISAAFPPAMLGRGLGIYMSCFSLAALLGPSVGGAVATAFGWRWVFWFNVPVGVICLIWGAGTLRKIPPQRQSSGMDLRGNILLILGLGGFVVALSEVSTYGWTSAPVGIGLGLAVVFIPLFVIAERRHSDPLLDMELFAHRPFTMATVAGLINSMANSSVIIIASLYFQGAKGDTALHAGLQLLPLSAANVLASASSGSLTKRIHPRTVSAIGAGISTCGLIALFIATGALASFGPICVGLVLVGLGGGTFQPANIASILEGTSPERLGSTNAVRLTVQNTAGVIGTALALTLLTAPLADALKHAVFAGTASSIGPQAVHSLVAGYRLAFGTLAVLSSLAVVASVASRSVHRAAQRELVPPPLSSSAR
jgi:EmrB/QacA subfamily drug resistance transporter